MELEEKNVVSLHNFPAGIFQHIFKGFVFVQMMLHQKVSGILFCSFRHFWHPPFQIHMCGWCTLFALLSYISTNDVELMANWQNIYQATQHCFLEVRTF